MQEERLFVAGAVGTAVAVAVDASVSVAVSAVGDDNADNYHLRW